MKLLSHAPFIKIIVLNTVILIAAVVDAYAAWNVLERFLQLYFWSLVCVECPD